MEGLKFFKGEKLPVYRMTPSVIMRNIPKDMSQITGEKPMPVRDNIDYVKKFQEEEDKLLLEVNNNKLLIESKKKKMSFLSIISFQSMQIHCTTHRWIWWSKCPWEQPQRLTS